MPSQSAEVAAAKSLNRCDPSHRDEMLRHCSAVFRARRHSPTNDRCRRNPSALVGVLRPANMRAPGPFSKTTHASVLPVSPMGMRHWYLSDGCTWTDTRCFTSSSFRSSGKRLRRPANTPSSSSGDCAANSAMVLPFSGPAATRLAWSSRSLNSHASPMGSSGDRPTTDTDRSARIAADKGASCS